MSAISLFEIFRIVNLMIILDLLKPNSIITLIKVQSNNVPLLNMIFYPFNQQLIDNNKILAQADTKYNLLTDD